MKHNILGEQDIMTQARTNLGEDVSTVLEACEAFHGHGFADEISGDVEAPTGYFYRVHRWIVVTDSQGFSDLETYDDENEARQAFATLDDIYGEWYDS